MPQITFHHRVALSPRLQAEDIEELLPVLASGLRRRGDRHAATNGVVAGEASTTPRRPSLVESFALALRDVKSRRLHALIAQSATHYESVEASGHESARRRPTSAVIYRSLGDAFDLNSLIGAMPQNKLHEQLLAAEHHTANPPRRPSSAKSAARPQSARDTARHQGKTGSSTTTELYVGGRGATLTSAGAPPAPSATNVAASVPIPHAPKRPTTAPPSRTAAPAQPCSTKPAEMRGPTDGNDDLGIADDSGEDGVHEAETAGGAAARQSAAAAKTVQLAATATKGTARIIAAGVQRPPEQFFTNFRFGSIREFLHHRKHVEFGSYRENVEQQLKARQPAEAAETPCLPTAREFVEAQAAEARQLASSARQLSVHVVAREQQERSVERLSQHKITAVLASSKRLTAALKRRPATAKSQR